MTLLLCVILLETTIAVVGGGQVAMISKGAVGSHDSGRSGKEMMNGTTTFGREVLKFCQSAQQHGDGQGKLRALDFFQTVFAISLDFLCRTTLNF